MIYYIARRRELLIAGPTQKIPITQDSLILPDRGFSNVINDDNFSLSKFILLFVIHYLTTRGQLIKTQSFSKTEAVNEIKINHDKAKYTHPDFRYALIRSTMLYSKRNSNSPLNTLTISKEPANHREDKRRKLISVLGISRRQLPLTLPFKT